MATKLKSVLQNPRLKLAFKAVVFACALALVKIGHFDIWPILIFIIVAGVIFLRPLFQTTAYLVPFILLVSIALLFLKLVIGFYFWLGWGIITCLFYLLLGVKTLVLVNRPAIMRLILWSYIYLVFLTFLLSDPTSFLALKIAMVFLTAYLIYQRLLSEANVVSAARNTAAALSALLSVEILLSSAWLPIGYIQAANLSFISSFAVMEVLNVYYGGRWDKKSALKLSAFFILAVLIILLASQWRML